MQERRPFLATECDDLQKAEKFRRQIIGEVSRKVAQIQNGKLLYFLQWLAVDIWICSFVLKSFALNCSNIWLYLLVFEAVGWVYRVGQHVQMLVLEADGWVLGTTSNC